MTITISGFKTKEEIRSWLTQYEGSMEQHFEDTPSYCDMDSYIPEWNEFENNEEKTNFNLIVQ